MWGVKLHVIFLVIFAVVLVQHVSQAARGGNRPENEAGPPGRNNDRNNRGGGGGGGGRNTDRSRPNHKEENEKRKIGRGRHRKGRGRQRVISDDRYIIKFKKGSRFADRERPLRRPAGKGKKVKALKRLRFAKIVGKLDAEDIEILKQDPNVEAVYLDEQAEIFCRFSYTHPDAWGADLLDGYRDYRLRNNVTKPADTNSTTVVYVVDTGVTASHDEFRINSTHKRAEKLHWVYNEAYMHPHGTAAADVAAGKWRGADSTAYIKDLRVMDNYGLGFNSDIVEGIDIALDDHKSRGTNARSVINMSLGSPTPESIIDDACEEAISEGMIVVAAAGNYGVNGDAFSPCRSKNVICVGAVDDQGQLAPWSNFGPVVDINAAGVNIPAASSEADNKYLLMSGTSFACPLVSGVVSAFLANSVGTVPNVTEVYDYLMKHASRTATFTDLPNTFGVDTSNFTITTTPLPTSSAAPVSTTTGAATTSAAVEPIPTTNAILRVGVC